MASPGLERLNDLLREEGESPCLIKISRDLAGWGQGDEEENMSTLLMELNHGLRKGYWRIVLAETNNDRSEPA